MREENTFEDPFHASEWIEAIESEKDGSRDREIYPLIDKWVKEVNPAVVLEMGSGQGICSEKIDFSTRSYIGIEPSVTLNNRAKELYKEDYKNFLIGNSYEIPLDNEVADAVFSVGVWFHIENLDKAHKEIYRILKNDGEVLILTANPNLYRLWESWFEDSVKDGNKIVGKVKVPTKTLSKNIFYLHSEEEIINSLKNNDFSIISIKKLGFGREGEDAYRDEGIWMAIRAIKKMK